MAQHIIRDSKGRIDKILNDQEYAEHQKQGCYAKLIFFGIAFIGAIILAIVGDCEGDKKKETTSSHKTEVIENATSSHYETVTTKSTNSSNSTNSTIDETAITTEEPTTEQITEEYKVSAEETVESTSSMNEPEQKLSRKERRALRKAQKNAEQEIED